MNEKNKEYWEDGTSYAEYVCQELNDERKDKWKRQMKTHLPNALPLRILDVGCGPGFFSCLLAEEGHWVIGIDRSEDMLKYARINAERLGVSAEFMVMDANRLEFDDDSFDLIVSRNVTWTFDEPENVYNEFYKKLKTGGKLLIYDANWHMPFYNPETLKRVRENERWYLETFGREFKVYDDDTEIFEGLPLSNIKRPEWDSKTLKRIGFSKIKTTENVGEYLYKDWEKRLYSETPMFEIFAVK